ncbi:hypothetical protein IFM89_007202 [Coptis chinensis]|uniref:Uncharacterized protein n=1 Tax=Coptis chinensis TaxID=261450 RepID=A0A835GY40_9MAGN|nr:hypothetical protein IFM89_007202 [Coptis chinensis]
MSKIPYVYGKSKCQRQNLVEDEATYYGIIRQIFKLDYQKFKQVAFFCDWVRIGDKGNGCVVDPDTNLDLSRDNWHVVLHAPNRLNHDVGAYEDPLVFEAMANLDGLAYALMGDIEGVEV